MIGKGTRQQVYRELSLFCRRAPVAVRQLLQQMVTPQRWNQELGRRGVDLNPSARGVAAHVPPAVTVAVHDKKTARVTSPGRAVSRSRRMVVVAGDVTPGAGHHGAGRGSGQ